VDGVVGLQCAIGSNGKREVPCAMAVEPFRKDVPMTAAPEPKARTPPRKAAPRDRAFDNAVEILNFGTGEIQLIPIVRGHLGGIDIFHVVSPWKPEVACGRRASESVAALHSRRGIGAT
jgi:hypothetical protein